MKYLLLCFSLVMLFTIANAQVNFVGKSQSDIIRDLAITEDTINKTIYGTKWLKGDTLVLLIYRVLPDTLNYHILFYFVDDICVHQRIIRLKQYKWTSGVVNTVVDQIEEYDIKQFYPIQQLLSDCSSQSQLSKNKLLDKVKTSIYRFENCQVIITNSQYGKQ